MSKLSAVCVRRLAASSAAKGSGLDLNGVSKIFPGGTLAVDDFDLHVDHGEYVVLLGPSGCGKTTTARLVLSLERATGGSLQFRGQEITTLTGPAWRDYRRAVQDGADAATLTGIMDRQIGLLFDGVRA